MNKFYITKFDIINLLDEKLQSLNNYLDEVVTNDGETSVDDLIDAFNKISKKDVVELIKKDSVQI